MWTTKRRSGEVWSLKLTPVPMPWPRLNLRLPAKLGSETPTQVEAKTDLWVEPAAKAPAETPKSFVGQQRIFDLARH